MNKILLLCFAAFLSTAAFTTPSTMLRASEPLNFIVIFADDLGYGDLGCYGSPIIRTPHLDRMAAEGMRFTDFYSAAEVCTPSRAALLTGRYPIRSGMCGARRVLFPDSPGGLPQDEVTIATALKAHGYRTMHVGKWHLGIHPGGTPQDHGFEHSFGLPYSNDMDANPAGKGKSGDPDPPHDGWNVPLLADGQIVEQPAKQNTLTKRYTEASLRFIEQNQKEPFFLYLAHTFPHVPMFASEDFRGKSRAGIFGDAVEELDWSVGQILNQLSDLKLAERTLVVFTSDNGPWLIMGRQGGSAGPLRDGKGSTWEGGMRVPGIFWLPGRIKPTVTHSIASTMDLLPTVLSLAHCKLPEKTIDGRDISPLLFSDSLETNKMGDDKPFFYYRGDQLFACRVGEWKAHFRTQTGYGKAAAETHDPPLLFHLGTDPGEHRNVANAHPDVIEQIRSLVQSHQHSITPVPSQLQ